MNQCVVLPGVKLRQFFKFCFSIFVGIKPLSFVKSEDTLFGCMAVHVEFVVSSI